MGSGATATTERTKRTPYDEVPREYVDAGGFEALPRTIRHLYGDKLPSGFAWAVLVFLNGAQLRNWRNKNTYEDIPAKAWSDGRTHRIATEALSIGDIADSVDCSTRTVEYAIADMVERGVLAKRKVGKLNQYALRFDAWDKVEPPVDAPPDPNDPDKTEDQTPRAPTDQPFRVYGSVAIKLPRVSTFGLAENVAQQFELTSIIVAGEHRIVEIRPIVANTNPATDCGNTPPNPLNSLETKIAEAPADYTATASAPSASKAWKDALNDFTLSLNPPEAAGFALVQRVSAVCTPLGITPLEFLAYCDQQRATGVGRKALEKCGAGILRQWAEHFALVRQNDRPKQPLTQTEFRPKWWPATIADAIAFVDDPKNPPDQVAAVLASDWGALIEEWRKPDPPKKGGRA